VPTGGAAVVNCPVPESPGSWDCVYSALTDAPLSLIGGPKGHVNWRVTERTARECPRLFVGVARADACVHDDRVDPRVYALRLLGSEQGDSWMYATLNSPDQPFTDSVDLQLEDMPTVSVTADLSTDTLHFSIILKGETDELLPATLRTLRVPRLATAHVFVAVSYDSTVELIDEGVL
jgi:hypothetical protein